MNKGFSLPIVLIVALFISLPVMFFFFSTRATAPNVKGAFTTANVGFDVQISSNKGTWDLFEFLCTTKEECTTSLTGGKRLETIGGGQVKTYDVVVEPDRYGRRGSPPLRRAARPASPLPPAPRARP